MSGEDPARAEEAERAERRLAYERALRARLTPRQYEGRAEIVQKIEDRLRVINESLDKLAKSLGVDEPGTPGPVQK